MKTAGSKQRYLRVARAGTVQSSLGCRIRQHLRTPTATRQIFDSCICIAMRISAKHRYWDKCKEQNQLGHVFHLDLSSDAQTGNEFSSLLARMKSRWREEMSRVSILVRRMRKLLKVRLPAAIREARQGKREKLPSAEQKERLGTSRECLQVSDLTSAIDPAAATRRSY
ncbi:PREDICTED: uncharacterized protein LOC106746475 isoform X5 [Dinoponera quadriceps]|uniref:Uncharacterized protein LOC106746475 isoform X5 n=1 Tax=Dinoponera quadriceps TaxID=609295 RepID=A0A6P3XKQ7_DINQU|nr:PREDICTED: uncharacterized protein LOC106746475 isoform X5 [Dinoponera quadriceps]